MYGHADSVLTKCSLCPSWKPKWATAINDEGKPVCTPHAKETCADLKVGA